MAAIEAAVVSAVESTSAIEAVAETAAASHVALPLGHGCWVCGEACASPPRGPFSAPHAPSAAH